MLQPGMLVGSHIRLDAFKEAEIPLVAEWHRDADFLRLMDMETARPQPEATVKEWMEEHRKRESAFLFAVRRLRDDAAVGLIELDGVLWNHRVAWLGIGIAPQYQGQGYGKEAMQLILRYGFRELNLHRIQLTVFGYNERAIRLYEQLGFVQEGRYREALHRDGQRYDMLLYGLLAHEWAAHQS